MAFCGAIAEFDKYPKVAPKWKLAGGPNLRCICPEVEYVAALAVVKWLLPTGEC